MVYLFTLFLSTATVVVDIIILINSFLGGELTTRFLLKVIATLVIALLVFGYYMYDLRSESTGKLKGKIFAGASAILVLASLVTAFLVIGSPNQERLRRFDEQRVMDLQNIQSRIVYYWQTKGFLPQNLASLEDSISGFTVPVQPETKEPYKYDITGTTEFSICANFDQDSQKQSYSSNESWNHGSGLYCFSRSIDPQIYQRIPNTSPVPQNKLPQ